MQHRSVLQVAEIHPHVSQDAKFTALRLADKLRDAHIRVEPCMSEALMVISTKICDTRAIRPSCAAAVHAERFACTLLDFRFHFEPPLSQAYERLSHDVAGTRRVEQLLNALLHDVARGQTILPADWAVSLAGQAIDWIHEHGAIDTLGFLRSFSQARPAGPSRKRGRISAPPPSDDDVVDLCCYESDTSLGES